MRVFILSLFLFCVFGPGYSQTSACAVTQDDNPVGPYGQFTRSEEEDRATSNGMFVVLDSGQLYNPIIGQTTEAPTNLSGGDDWVTNVANFSSGMGDALTGSSLISLATGKSYT